MEQNDIQSDIDYTNVPLGLCIEGQIWTGQNTTFTALCPKCGRTGVTSTIQHNKQIVVHRGRANGNKLEGIEFCRIVF